jgi:dGTPase
MITNFKTLKVNPKFIKRQYEEIPIENASLFSLDRDRIIYSKEFRRLNGKTQVFITGFDDNIRNRLTHTLEVSQISQTIANCLGFDETLTESIALAHDVGHTPFGHVGERTLNYIMNGCDSKLIPFDIPNNLRGFKHNWQGLRVVNDLEKKNKKYTGINLSEFTLWGILNHSKLDFNDCKHSFEERTTSAADDNPKITKMCNFLNKNEKCIFGTPKLSVSFYERYKKCLSKDSWTFEGLTVNIADEIAQRHHDIEDSLLTGLISHHELIDVIYECFPYKKKEIEKDLNKIINENDPTYYLPQISNFIHRFLLENLISNTRENLSFIINKYGIKSNDNFHSLKTQINTDNNIHSLICYNDEFKNSEEKFQDFIWNRIINSHIAQRMDGKSKIIIRSLFESFLMNPQHLPDTTIITLYKNYLSKSDWDKIVSKQSYGLTGTLREKIGHDYYQQNSLKFKNVLLRTICDYIAGMTDGYAIKQYNIMYGTNQVFKSF